MLRIRSTKKKLEENKLQYFTQKELNELIEPPDMRLYVRYCNLIRTFLVSVFFFDICPIGMPICLLYLIVQFWVDKSLILGRYKRIPRFHPKLSQDLNEIAEYSIFLLAAGALVFKWKAGLSLNVVDLCCIGLGVLFLILPLKVLLSNSNQSNKVIEDYNMQNTNYFGNSPHNNV